MTYEEAKEHGMKAARAINQHDQARYNFEKDWFNRAIANDEHRVELREMWNAGYKEVREQNIKFLNLSRRD